MIVIYLLPDKKSVMDITLPEDISKLQLQIEWLLALPRNADGERCFYFTNDGTALWMSNDDDALAFKLKFGL